MTADWQKGFDLDRLRAFAAPFKAAHKPLIFGAFGLINERDIADALARTRVVWTGDPPQAVALFSIRKAAGDIGADFTQRAIAAGPGDVVVKGFAAFDVGSGAKVLRAIEKRAGDAQIWLEIFEEDPISKQAAGEAGFGYVTTKIAAGSEIKGVYARRPQAMVLAPADRATLEILDRDFLTVAEHTAIKDELARFADYWAQHYSNYNKRKSWQAFALRGYDDDPAFIIKPAEMAKAWKAENARRLADRPRMTKASEHFPATLSACARIAQPMGCDRIRFMRLSAKGGELGRHADITDRDAGTADGMIMRLHIPITTSPA